MNTENIKLILKAEAFDEISSEKRKSVIVEFTDNNIKKFCLKYNNKSCQDSSNCKDCVLKNGMSYVCYNSITISKRATKKEPKGTYTQTIKRIGRLQDKTNDIIVELI